MVETEQIALVESAEREIVGEALYAEELVGAPSGKNAGDAAEAFISEKRLGERIKSLRLKKSMGLVELGRHTGLSASFLSQLETGRVVPTLRNLARIAIVFSKDLSYFFEPEPKTLFRVHRSHERVRLPQTGTDEPSYFFESLGYMVPDRQLDPYYIEFLPGVKPRRAHQHPGHEFLYLLEGELDIQHGVSVFTLQAGDAAYFDAGVAHSYICKGEQAAKTLLVTLQGNGSGVQQQGNGTVQRARPNGINGHANGVGNGVPNGNGLRPRLETLARAS